MLRDLPSGTVTFLFTDVEGSTRLLHELGAEMYAEALAEHRRLIRDACVAQGGVEVDTQGDAFFFAFPTAPGALGAGKAMTEALASGPIQVRVGLHTGTPLLTEEGYVGDDVHFGARVAASSHGGQIVLSSTTAALVELPLTDLGEHRLKDIREAVSIFQLGEESFPPLKTISNTNLPRPASSFVGREQELAQVLSRIQDGARLLTLTGPGGSGKTRLALEAAATLVPEYKAGVFWVGLAALRDSALVTETISQTLGAKDGLAEHVGEREMLLLLDNLERVIEAAPELAALLSACPNLTLLVTSRELLRVQGEVEYPVPPLAEPEAVFLFCERAQIEPSEEIAELCAHLDNLPLAVELAAARTKALSPGQILERLSERLDLLKGGRDADPRQQTLRATIEWSYDLLTAQEQQLFARLSVFAGGCTLEAAEEVCDADLDTLQSLVEKSLLRFSNERYWMLETIREFAEERLEESGEAGDIRQRHADFILALAAQAEQGLVRDSDRTWLARLAPEQDNFRAALAWMEKMGQTGAQLDLIGRNMHFWDVRGDWLEGLRWVELALARSEGERSGRRARALVAGSCFTHSLGDLDAAKAYAEESLSIYSELGDTRGISSSLNLLGLLASQLGEYDEAARLFEDAIDAAREAGDRVQLAILTGNLGDLAARQADYDRAIALSEEWLALSRELGQTEMIAMALYNVAMCVYTTGRIEEAVVAARESLAHAQEVGSVTVLIVCFVLLGSVAAHRGDDEVAARLIGAADALRERIGLALPEMEAELHRETVEEIRQALGEKKYEMALAEGRAMALDATVAYALSSVD